MNALPKRFFTQEESADLEAMAAYKSQYVAGEIYGMAGDRMRIGHFIRQAAGGWAFREYNAPEDVLPLA